jgi:hypothetical protein
LPEPKVIAPGSDTRVLAEDRVVVAAISTTALTVMATGALTRT